MLLVNKKSIVSSIVCAVLFCVSLCGCSSNPPEDSLKECILTGTSYIFGYREGKIDIDSYNITNKYTRIINGEKVNVYEVEYKIRLTPKAEGAKLAPEHFQLHRNIFGLVKRGKKWYYIRLN